MFFHKNFPHTRQLESKDCGPACLQMICKYYGSFYELEFLRELTGIRKEGISVYDYVVAAEKLGLRSQAFSMSYWKFRNEMPLPCTVHWKGHHFVVVYKITSKYIYVSDPQTGLVKYTLKEFAQGWLGHLEPVPGKNYKRGICIATELTDRFNQTNHPKKQSGYLDMAKYLWTYVKPYKKSVLKVIMLMFVITFISALFPIITQSIIDIGIPAKNFNFITLMLVSSLVLTIGNALGNWMKQLINTHFAARIKLGMQSDFISRLFSLPVSFFETRLMGDIMQRNYDYDRLEGVLMGGVFDFVLGIFQLFLFGSILFFYNKTIFWIFVVASLLYVVWVLFFWSIRKKMDIRYFSYLAKNQSHWVEMLSKIADIKSYNYGMAKRWQWEKVQTKLFKTRIKLLNVDQIQNTGSILLMSFKALTLIYVASLAVMEGEMTIGMLIAVQYILGQMQVPMESLINFIMSIQLSNLSYMRINEISSITPEEPIHKEENTNMTDYDQNLCLNNVYFKYNINDNYVLKNVSCLFPKHKITALVGESGCGKSTLIKLLGELYIPTSGYLSLGQMHLPSISLEEWRTQCGILTQDSTLLNDTILNNILLGRELDKERLFDAVNTANIKDEIEKMPLAYQTRINETGGGVSEGQKQRILFARAIYGRPQYLFLDELTSSLDPNNEMNIIESIKNRLEHPTIVIAAHRLSSVKEADQILVMKDGQIIEIGNHEFLMKKKGEYFRLFNRQLITA
ncbi:peptidase domain-containing ABC transporter [Paraprevotella xylaniphila]|nr:peptidase domain-containing ABC transporter [Paraprevotella xylaniphila]